MNMPKRLQETRDELMVEKVSKRPEYIDRSLNQKTTFKWGFNACWEELAPVVEALKKIVEVSGSSTEHWLIAHQALKRLENDNG